MEKHEVWLTRRAQEDLNASKKYIAKHAPEAAEPWYVACLEALLDLEVNPQGRARARKRQSWFYTLRIHLPHEKQTSQSRFVHHRGETGESPGHSSPRTRLGNAG